VVVVVAVAWALGKGPRRQLELGPLQRCPFDLHGA
jgi:hypothetical protein